MKTTYNTNYYAPEVEIVELQVEQGFAGSVVPQNWDAGNDDWFIF